MLVLLIFIRMLGEIKDVAEDDVIDQVRFAYGHKDVASIYPLAGPGGSLPVNDVMQIRELLAREIRTNLGWFSFPLEMRSFQIASAQHALEVDGTDCSAWSSH